jgi:hypothetical protein
VQRYTNFIASTTATNSTLTVLSNASCVVYIAGTLGAATLYSDNGVTPLANPFVSSATGRIDFYAANGRYDVVVSKVGYLSVTINDIELDDLLAPSGSNSVGYLPAGTGAVASTVQTKLRESVSVKDFGAVGDGTTNDFAAITLAIAASSGNELFFPAGTYVINYTTSACFSPLVNTRLTGAGAGITKLQFTASSASSRNLFSMGFDNLTIEKMTLQIVEVAGGQCGTVAWNANNLTLRDCAFAGGVTNVGATVNSSAYGVVSPQAAGTQSGLLIDGCSFSRFNWPFLKANAAVSVQKQLKITNNDFFNTYESAISLNAPNGAISEVIITGNTLRDPLGPSAAPTVPYTLGVALASVTSAVISGNTIIGDFGTGVGAIHLEERCIDVSIANNQITTTGLSSYGLILQTNNISGTYYSPEQTTVTGNTFKYTGTALGSVTRGIVILNNGNGIPNKFVISDNAVANYEIGIVLGGSNAQSNVVANNFITACTFGLQVFGGTSGVAGNVTDSCAYGILLQDSAAFAANINAHVFQNCTVTAYQGTSGRPLVLVNPRFVLPTQTVGAASTTNIVLTQALANCRIYGFMTSSATATVVADNAQRIDEITWDGATFTNTNKVTWVPGAISLTPVRVGTNFSVQLIATNATSAQIVCQLDGMISLRL